MTVILNTPQVRKQPPRIKTAIVFNIQKFSLHDGPGIRTVVFLKGCPLRCPWCSNPESMNTAIETMRDPETGEASIVGKTYSINELLDICEDDRPFYDESGGGVTLSGGEAMVQHSFVIDFLEALQDRHIHTAMETTGYVAPRIFVRALDHLNYLMIDMKHHNRDTHKKWTGRFSDLPQQNITAAVQRNIDLCVRIPVIPGFNSELSDARAFAEKLIACGVFRVQLLPFHQFGERKWELLGRKYTLSDIRPLHAEDLEEYRNIFLTYGVTAYF